MTTSPPFSQTLAHIIQDDGHRNGHGQNRSDDDARLESLVLRFRYWRIFKMCQISDLFRNENFNWTSILNIH